MAQLRGVSTRSETSYYGMDTVDTEDKGTWSLSVDHVYDKNKKAVKL